MQCSKDGYSITSLAPMSRIIRISKQVRVRWLLRVERLLNISQLEELRGRFPRLFAGKFDSPA
jgi:hypothetical protein